MDDGDQDQAGDQYGQQQVSDAETDASVEKTRSTLMTDFANAVGNYNQRIQTNFTAALSNFDDVAKSPSPEEVKGDLLKVVIETAFDEGMKEAIKSLGEYAPAASAVFAFSKAIKEAVEKRAVAETNYDVAAWIVDIRSAVTDAYSDSGGSDAVLNRIRDAYANCSSEDDRQNLIDKMTFAAAAIEQGDWSVPAVELYERSLYEGWANGHFTVIGAVDDGISGFVDIRFEDGDTPKSVALVAPLGGQMGDRLNKIASAANLSTMMDLAVHKRVCRWADNPAGGSGWSCGWFDEENRLINEPNSEDVTAFLNGSGWRSNVTQFEQS